MPRIQRFIAVWKFEMGASAMGGDRMLNDAGYRVQATGAGYRIWAPGARKPKTVNQQGLIKLLDEVRVAQGLQPICKRG